MSETPRVSIRPARRDDVPLLVEIFASDEVGKYGDTTDPGALPLYLAAFDAIADSPGEAVYVAEWDGVVAGMCKTGLLTTLTGPGTRTLVIQTVHVRSDLRGCGIGHEMMQFCIAYARDTGVDAISLTTNKLRADAHRFYDRLGFEQTHFGYKMRFN